MRSKLAPSCCLPSACTVRCIKTCRLDVLDVLTAGLLCLLCELASTTQTGSRHAASGCLSHSRRQGTAGVLQPPVCPGGGSPGCSWLRVQPELRSYRQAGRQATRQACALRRLPKPTEGTWRASATSESRWGCGGSGRLGRGCSQNACAVTCTQLKRAPGSLRSMPSTRLCSSGLAPAVRALVER